VIWFHVQAEHAATESLVSALQHRRRGFSSTHATKLLNCDEIPTQPQEQSAVTAFSVRPIDPGPDDSSLSWPRLVRVSANYQSNCQMLWIWQ